MPNNFAPRLLDWFDRHGRHDLPWQHPRNAYRVWIAEIMLQQTQVATVIPYYQRFMVAFPDLPTLAAAKQDAVLALWSGLGYYSRARNLHAAAKRCVEVHGSALPDRLDALQALPGIGRSTAAAICAQAYGQPTAILDGNVKRVLCRVFGIEGWPGQRPVELALWQRAEQLMPATRCADYTQAIMDFGATLCTRGKPACGLCPFRADCVALSTLRIDVLPTPRPRKTLPQRECQIVVLLDPQRRILLQRKPERGVWAGLWSLPQFEHEDEAVAFTQHHTCAKPAEPLSPIEHSFSHYHLRLNPQLHRLEHARWTVGDNPDWRWTVRNELDQLGLPAPIRRLLMSIKEFH